MKIQNVLFISLITLVLFSSCKKDYDFEVELLPTDGASKFYARGQNQYGPGNSYFFDWIGGERIDSAFNVAYGSASAIGEAGGKKYIVSGVSLDARVFRNRVLTEVESNILGFMRNGIYLKVLTDSPIEANPQKFTKAELEDLFQVGKIFTIGEQPGQVEIGLKDQMLSQEILDNIVWQFPAMRGVSTSDLNTEHTVEVLEIGTYEDPVDHLYARGLTVKVRFDVTLDNQLWVFQDLSLRNVEAVF
ncbi:MAG: hypothetical protein AAF985_07775, partial [Bacteroidota bacterium]